MRNIFIEVEYDGTDYKGWQKQKGFVTVAGEIERTIKDVFNIETKLTGASRTDAKVHARGQCANFLMPLNIEVSRLKKIINSNLPKDIAIVGIAEKPKDFSARFSAKGKHYRYIINNAETHCPFTSRYSLFYSGHLDVEAMKRVAVCFEGTKDFAALAANAKIDVGTVRTVDSVTVTQKGFEIHIDVYGKSFLYKMVRTMAGLIFDVGKKSLSEEQVSVILESKDRAKARKTLSGSGLYLMKVYY